MSKLTGLFTNMTHELTYISKQGSEAIYADTIPCSTVARKSATHSGHVDSELSSTLIWPEKPPDWNDPDSRPFRLEWEELCAQVSPESDDYLELDLYLRWTAYRDIQAAPRNKHNIPPTPAIQQKIDGATRALRRLPKFQGSVVRHVNNLPPEVLDRYQKGETITEVAFTSTTRNLDGVPKHRERADVEMRIQSKTGSDLTYVPLVKRKTMRSSFRLARDFRSPTDTSTSRADSPLSK